MQLRVSLLFNNKSHGIQWDLLPSKCAWDYCLRLCANKNLLAGIHRTARSRSKEWSVCSFSLCTVHHHSSVFIYSNFEFYPTFLLKMFEAFVKQLNLTVNKRDKTANKPAQTKKAGK